MRRSEMGELIGSFGTGITTQGVANFFNGAYALSLRAVV